MSRRPIRGGDRRGFWEDYGSGKRPSDAALIGVVITTESDINLHTENDSELLTET